MSYAMSEALQQSVFTALQADASVAATSGGHIFDAVPAGPAPDLYLRLGPERVRDLSDGSGRGAVHDFAIVVVSDRAGFRDAKTLAGAVTDAISGADLPLARGRVVSMRFRRAQARWLAAGREIVLWFRAHLDEDD